MCSKTNPQSIVAVQKYHSHPVSYSLECATNSRSLIILPPTFSSATRCLNVRNMSLYAVFGLIQFEMWNNMCFQSASVIRSHICGHKNWNIMVQKTNLQSCGLEVLKGYTQYRYGCHSCALECAMGYSEKNSVYTWSITLFFWPRQPQIATPSMVFLLYPCFTTFFTNTRDHGFTQHS